MSCDHLYNVDDCSICNPNEMDLLLQRISQKLNLLTSGFWLFAGEVYYPSGGVEDFQGIYPTLRKAQDAFEALVVTERFAGGAWAHVALFDGARFTRFAQIARAQGPIYNVADIEWEEIREVYP